jgi:hypothetical protein
MSTFHMAFASKKGTVPFFGHSLLLKIRKRGQSPFCYKEESWISWN